MTRTARLLVLVTAVALVASCRSTTAGPGGTTPMTVAFVTNNSSDFWTIARRGVEKADAELADISAEFRIDADGTAAEQKRIIDDLLTKHVAGIAISPVDPQNQTPLLNDVAKQALVFTQDSDAPSSARACYVGTDNVAAGRQAGQLIKDALPGGAGSCCSSASSMRRTRRIGFRASARYWRGRTSTSSTCGRTMWMMCGQSRMRRIRW